MASHPLFSARTLGFSALLLGPLLGCGTPKEGVLWDDSAAVEETDADGFADGSDVEGLEPGDDCAGVEGVLDCHLECWVEDARDYLGDDVCDEGGRGPDFNCEELNYDRGDCAAPDDSAGTTDDGGATEGDTAEGDTAEGGTTEGGSSEGGTTEGSTTEGGTTEGGTTEGGTSEGSTTEGGTTEGGSGTGGSGDATAGSGGSGGDCLDAGGLLVLLDCSDVCVTTAGAGLLGDETCDSGERGPNFNCETWGYDAGDCEDPSETSGDDGGEYPVVPGGDCERISGGLGVYDCLAEECRPTSWLGDGIYDSYYDMDCAETVWDGGDCI